MFHFSIRTPLVTGDHGTNGFIVVHMSGGDRHVPLAVTSTSVRGNAVALIMRGMKLSSAGLYTLGRNSRVRSIIKPLNGPARVRGFNAIVYTNNNMNMTPVLPVVGTLGTTNGQMLSIVTNEDGSLIVVRSRIHTSDSRLVVVASSKDCNRGNMMAMNVRGLVGRRRVSGIFTVNPPVVVGFYYLLARGCGLSASMSLGAVVMSNANVYKTYHLAVNNGAGFIYVSNPRFSNTRMS